MDGLLYARICSSSVSFSVDRAATTVAYTIETYITWVRTISRRHHHPEELPDTDESRFLTSIPSHVAGSILHVPQAYPASLANGDMHPRGSARTPMHQEHEALPALQRLSNAVSAIGPPHHQSNNPPPTSRARDPPHRRPPIDATTQPWYIDEARLEQIMLNGPPPDIDSRLSFLSRRRANGLPDPENLDVHSADFWSSFDERRDRRETSRRMAHGVILQRGLGRARGGAWGGF